MTLRKFLDVICYGAGGAYVLLFLFTALLRLIYPYEVEWNEGAILDHAIRILNGKPIYAAPSLDFAAFVYTPFFYYVTAFLMKIGGVGLWSGRLISILATLATALIAGRIVHRETHSSQLAFAGGALYIAFYHVTGFFYDIVRMDALAVFFAAASIYTALYIRRGYLWAALFAATAYFTKQQMLFVFPAVIIGLAIRDMKQALLFTIISISLLVFGTIVLNGMTDGWYRFYTITIPSLKAAQSFSWKTAIEFFPTWVMGMLGFFTFIILVFIALQWKKNRLRSGTMLLSCYGFALISSALSIGNSGGYQNVFMPLTLMIAILFPLSIFSIAVLFHARAEITSGILLLGFLSLFYNPLGQTMLFASPRQRKAGDEFVTKLKVVPGDVWLPFHGYISTLAGKPTHVHFMAMNDALLPHGVASNRFQHEIDSSLDTHRFSAIIFDEEHVFHFDSLEHYSRDGRIFSEPNVFLSRIGDAPTRPNFIYLPTP